ncbi:MarR family winged helix-turn-helix transcriptional regulator [Bailinhaonella thermotolerans]|uniref:MarR family transcriptional regulator n=1 Tax=Bailinhaonella thermotolerans TaxID=1070861 RepID=A0A3A4ARR8_9ACTN|nr:MarR family winged helix-turn-helix transcriptional regulator [Bailinhaonella thermotolerans]RJL23988.1 MarR family transcriptional regulator [Bailinhaonella thermotolerans]
MSGPRWLTETQMRAWTGFLEASGLIQRHVERQLRQDAGLTMIQYEILHWANECAPQHRCITELADLMITSRSGLSYQVAQLEKAGLLRRETDASDERRAMVVITDDGRRLLEKTAPGHVEAVRDGLIDLLTDEQIAQLADIMDDVRTRLRPRVRPAAPRKRAT